jgi:methionyl-tRNA synthetase
VPDAVCSQSIRDSISGLYSSAGPLIENGSVKEALELIFAYVRASNKYFDEEQPWITVKSEPDKCRVTLNTCVQIIANLSILLEPFLPFSSAKVKDILHLGNPSWQYHEVQAGSELGPVEILFERIDKKLIQEEEERLKNT